MRDIEIRGSPPINIDLRHRTIEVLDDKNGTAWGEGVVIAMEGLRWVADNSAPRARGGGAERPKSAFAQRLDWLSLQYPPPDRRPNIDDFRPDVYDRLARQLRAAGYYGDALAVTRDKLRVEREISGISFARPFLFLYAVLFDSGMSPARAVATFLCCIAIGTAAVYVADRGWSHPHIDPVLVRETPIVNSLVVPSQESAPCLCSRPADWGDYYSRGR